ncbi:MAG: hypothetical protein ACRC8Q_10835 [Aeromonas sp.]
MPRFGSDFLAGRQALQAGWAKKGVKTGSGRQFGQDFQGGTGVMATVAAPPGGALGQMSPHAKALASLARTPSNEKGHEEHYEQVRIFDCIERTDPELYSLMVAIPNGGHRSKKTGADLKAEGVKAGYPDIIIDYPAGAYHGCRIELKASKGVVSEAQIVMLTPIICRVLLRTLLLGC